MSNRERILAAGVALLVGLIGVRWFVDRVIQEPLRLKDAELATLSEQVMKKQQELQEAQDAEFDIRDWQSRALPADMSLAQPLYLDFLQDSLALAGIHRPQLLPVSVERRANHYSVLRCPINVKCTLDELTRFMNEFYATDLLHNFRNISIKPSPDHKGVVEEFDVAMTVEAVSLHDAVADDSLPGVDEFQQEPKPLAEELTLFASKNLFQPTELKKPAPPIVARARPPAPEPDERGDYYINATLRHGSVGTVTFFNKKTKKELELHEGDKIEISGLKNAKVVEVSPPKVLLQVDGSLALGVLGGDLKSLVIQGPVMAERSGKNAEE